MKAIVVHEFGGPEVPKLEEFPTPKPAAGQVLVRVHAVGVNPYDASRASRTSESGRASRGDAVHDLGS